jgi:hypothetical protein
MAFADPQSVTVNAVAQSLARTSTGDHKSEYSKDDGTYSMKISHQLGARNRRTLRLETFKIAADPYLTATNKKVSMTVYVVVDVPPQGYTVAEQKLVTDGFVAYLAASSGAAMTKLLGGEN